MTSSSPVPTSLAPGRPARDPGDVRDALARRTITALVLAAVALAAASGVVWNESVAYDRTVSDLSRADALREALDSVRQSVVDGETAARGFAISGDPQFLAPLEAAERELPRHLAAMHATADGIEVDPIERAVAARMAHTREIVATVQGEGPSAARARVATSEGRRLTDRVRSEIGRAETEIDARFASVEVAAERSRTRARWAIGVLAVLAVLVSVGSIAAFRRDLAALTRAGERLRASERRFREIAETSSDLVLIYEPGGSVLFASASAERLLGKKPDAIVGTDPNLLVASVDRERIVDIARGCLSRGESPPALLHRMRHADGSLRWFETRLEPIADEDGRLARVHASSRDVSARVRAEAEARTRQEESARAVEEMREISERDAATGLLNRRGLAARSGALVRAAHASGKSVLVLFCDLNGLKAINDQLGHEEGDRAIADAAAVLRDVARGTDLVARLGGDELVVMAVWQPGVGADAFRARLADRLARHDREAGRRYLVSMSVGAVEWQDGDARSLDDVLAAADEAMYVEKRQRRSAATPDGRPIVREPA